MPVFSRLPSPLHASFHGMLSGSLFWRCCSSMGLSYQTIRGEYHSNAKLFPGSKETPGDKRPVLNSDWRPRQSRMPV